MSSTNYNRCQNTDKTLNMVAIPVSISVSLFLKDKSMSSSFVLLKCKCAPVSYRPVWEISNTVMVFAQMRTLSIGAACEFTRGSEHFAGPCLVHSPQWLGKDDRVALHPPLPHLDLLQADHLLWPPIVLVWQGEHFLPRKIMWVEDQQPNWNQAEGFGRRKIVYLQHFWIVHSDFFFPAHFSTLI